MYKDGEEMRNGLGIFIEGNEIKVTPYDRFMIPSPMSLMNLKHDKCI